MNAVQWRNYLGRNFFQPCLTIFNNVLMVAIMLTALFIVQPVVSVLVLIVLGSSARFIFVVIKRQLDSRKHNNGEERPSLYFKSG